MRGSPAWIRTTLWFAVFNEGHVAKCSGGAGSTGSDLAFQQAPALWAL